MNNTNQAVNTNEEQHDFLIDTLPYGVVTDMKMFLHEVGDFTELLNVGLIKSMVGEGKMLNFYEFFAGNHEEALENRLIFVENLVEIALELMAEVQAETAMWVERVAKMNIAVAKDGYVEVKKTQLINVPNGMLAIRQGDKFKAEGLYETEEGKFAVLVNSDGGRFVVETSTLDYKYNKE